jgi:hypothetical protein
MTIPGNTKSPALARRAFLFGQIVRGTKPHYVAGPKFLGLTNMDGSAASIHAKPGSLLVPTTQEALAWLVFAVWLVVGLVV